MVNDDPLSILRRSGASGATVIELDGPVTLRNLFALQDELRSTEPCGTTILDFTKVPYMDSAGIGAIVNHFVHCQKCGCKMIAAGVNNRVLELFKLTRVNTVIGLTASVEEAEAQA